MRVSILAASILLLACVDHVAAQATPANFQLPDSLLVREGPTGTRIDASDFLRRLARADFVLLGEVHDNGVQHALRGQLIAALAARRPAVVFEQFAASESAIAPPAAGETR